MVGPEPVWPGGAASVGGTTIDHSTQNIASFIGASQGKPKMSLIARGIAGKIDFHFILSNLNELL